MQQGVRRSVQAGNTSVRHRRTTFAEAPSVQSSSPSLHSFQLGQERTEAHTHEDAAAQSHNDNNTMTLEREGHCNNLHPKGNRPGAMIWNKNNSHPPHLPLVSAKTGLDEMALYSAFLASTFSRCAAMCTHTKQSDEVPPTSILTDTAPLFPRYP